MSSERLRSLVSDLCEMGVKAVVLVGGGEPLLHPAIGDALTLLHEGKVHVGVTTNGTLIHRHLETLAGRTEWVRVSVDAGSDGVYTTFRPSRSGRNEFHKVIRNMEALARSKVGKLGYSFLASVRRQKRQFVTNVSDIALAARLARDIGCDYFEVKPMYDIHHFLTTYPDEVIETLQAQLVEAISLETPGFKIIAPQTLRAVMGRERLVQPKNYSFCPISELRTLITPTGCFICPYHRGRADKRSGNIATGSFRNIWLSEERRRVSDSTDPSVDCTWHCIRHRSNEFILGLREREGSGEIETRSDYDRFI